MIGEWRCDGADRDVDVRKSEATAAGAWRDELQVEARASTAFSRQISRGLSDIQIVRGLLRPMLSGLCSRDMPIWNFPDQMTAAALIPTILQPIPHHLSCSLVRMCGCAESEHLQSFKWVGHLSPGNHSMNNGSSQSKVYIWSNLSLHRCYNGRSEPDGRCSHRLSVFGGPV